MTRTLETALVQSARTITRHLRVHPNEPRAQWLGDVFAELCAGLPRAPRLARADVTLRAADRASVAPVILGMWRDMAAHDALTPERAAALAGRIVAVTRAPAVLFVLAEEARTREHDEAARLLLHAIPRAFLRSAPRLRIDRALLASLGLALDGAVAVFHDDGHLASLTKGKRALTLASTPGAGRYREEGKRGGSGFAIDERYEDGHARGTFHSPWHDGEEYANEQPWLAWVSACAATVLSSQ